MQPGFANEDGSRRYPATSLVCNFGKPTAKKPSLLKHDEVVTLFHGTLLLSFFISISPESAPRPCLSFPHCPSLKHLLTSL